MAVHLKMESPPERRATPLLDTLVGESSSPAFSFSVTLVSPEEAERLRRLAEQQQQQQQHSSSSPASPAGLPAAASPEPPPLLALGAVNPLHSAAATPSAGAFAPPPGYLSVTVHSARPHASPAHTAGSVTQLQASGRSVRMRPYRLEKRVVLRESLLRSSPFFAEKMRNEWRGARSVSLGLPRMATVHTFVMAVEFMATGRLPPTRRGLFELLAVSHFLRLVDLQQRCAERVASLLSPSNVMVAAHFAHRCGLDALLHSCHAWLLSECVERGHFAPAVAAALDGRPGTLGRLFLQEGVYSLPLSALVAPMEREAREAARFCAPAEPRFYGTVVRHGGGEHKAAAVYDLHALDGGAEPLLRAQFCEASGEYVIRSVAAAGAEAADPPRPHGRGVVGHVRSNLTGTHFTVYGPGTQAHARAAAFPAPFRREEACVRYRRNILGTVPREFTAALRGAGAWSESRAEEDAARVAARVEAALGGGGKAERPPRLEDEADTVELMNRPPVWNEALQAYTLDFGDYVKLPSKKNFQLVEAGGGGASGPSVLMFGKVEPNRFHLDFAAPVTPLQAFGIVVSSFDKKRFVT